MGYDVFISHCKDDDISNAVYDYLTNNGVRCFLDSRCLQIGEVYLAHIYEARESCSVVILILSSNSDTSTAVLSELNDMYKKKIVIPVKIEDFKPKNVETLIGIIQRLDAFESPFNQYLPKILEAVSHYLKVEPTVIRKPSVPDDIIIFLSKFVKELDLNYPSFDPNEERITIGEHSLRVLRLFDKYRIFNKMIFPENIIGRDKFMVVLALHDIGMAKVANRDDIKVKYGIAQQTIHWLINQPDFKGKYGFNAQEEQISLALVSNGPIWRYLNNRFDEITCAEQIMNMAVKAGIEIGSQAFHYFFQLVTIHYLCDAGSYSTLVGGDRKYDFISFDDSNKEIKLVGVEKEKIDTLEVVINKITKGAIPFAAYVWKRIKEIYFNDFARNNTAKMKQGEILKGRYFQYRYNSKLRIYEICPRSSTKLPVLYDPNY